jgi:hypothetical protein
MKKIQFEKKITFSLDNKISFVVFNGNNFIVFDFKNLGKKYFRLPNFVDSVQLMKENNTFVFGSGINFLRELEKLSFLLSNYPKSLDRPYRKKLVLKGLGYKVNLTNRNQILELKLGFSHSINLDIPKTVSVKINKQSINLGGFDKALVGSFSNSIRKLRLPDNYKGKGVWYKNEVRIFKELKKK